MTSSLTPRASAPHLLNGTSSKSGPDWDLPIDTETMAPRSSARRAETQCLVVSWNRSLLGSRVVSQVEKHFIHVTPAPAFGGVIALYDEMVCCMIVAGRMATGRLIAAAYVSATPTDSKVNPRASGLQTLLAAERAGRHLFYAAQMRADFSHDHSRKVTPQSHWIGLRVSILLDDSIDRLEHRSANQSVAPMSAATAPI
jgi:hypothetical protein